MTEKNISLKFYNTFRLDCRAETFVSIKSEDEAVTFIKSGKTISKPFMILGGGSNLLFVSDFKGTILHPVIYGINEISRDQDHVLVNAGAGVIWDKFVEWSVNNGYGGAENLSLIPGSVGATPVQNIGAYGVEVQDIIQTVRVISLETGEIKDIRNEDCRFGYRDSIFKGELKNKYIITRVIFKLSLKPQLKTQYSSLKDELERLGPIDLKKVREAIIKIRRSKLPDPSVTGNAGSFFKNPSVNIEVAEYLKQKYPTIPVYEDKPGKAKLSAGWLIEKCGWKGKRIGDAGVSDRQALVLVNFGEATGREILELSEMIRKSVLNEFGIDLEREVELVGAI